MIQPNNNTGSSASSIFIRGIGQSDTVITTDPGVGVYIDGVYLASTTGALLDLADFSEVEILRGPQGTLFGKNTIGGAINITTRAPGDTFGGHFDVTLGNFGRWDLSGAVDIPISDTSAFRLSFLQLRDDGYSVRADGVELGMHHRDIGRLQWRWTPSDTLTVNWSADATRKKENQNASTLLSVNPLAPLAALQNAFVSPFDDRWVPSNPFFNYGTAPVADNLDSAGTSVRVVWKPGAVTFSSITAYRNQTSYTAEDADQSPANLLYFTDYQHIEQFSHEDHLSGSAFGSTLDWLVGVIYFRESANEQQLSLQAADLIPYIGNITVFDTDSIVNNTEALFADATWRFAPNWKLTAGIRGTHEEKDWQFQFQQAITFVTTIPPGERSQSWNPVTPKLDVDFQLSDSVMTYVSAANGFRSGGFNARANTVTGLQSFDPETVWTYELGMKAEALDKRLRLNTDVFYSDYKNQQLLIIDTTPSGGFVVLTENAARSRVQGVEAEITARPIRPLELSASIGYLDTRVQSAIAASGVVPGDNLQQSPRWTGNAAIQYTQPAADGALMYRADYTVKSGWFNDAANTEAVRSGGYGLVNGRISYESARGWNVALFVKNMLDKRYLQVAIDTGSFGFNEGYFGPPREYGISLGYKF
jgi:iron complex outermembrane receptor protein